MKAAVVCLAVPLLCLDLRPCQAQDTPDKPIPGLIYRLGGEYLRHAVCQSAAYSPDGTMLATGGMDIRVWDVKTRQLLRVMPMPDRQIDGDAVQMQFSPDGKSIYVRGGSPGQVSRFDVVTGKRLYRIENVSPFALSLDGKLLATGEGSKGEIVLRKADTREKLRTLTGHKRADPGPPADSSRNDVYVESLAFSPDGKWLASRALYDDFVRIFEVETGKEKHTLPCPSLWGMTLAVSPDGCVATYRQPKDSNDKTKTSIVLWDMATGKVVQEFDWSPQWGPGYHGLTFSPDGKWMAGDRGKSTLCVWDRATGKIRYSTPHRPGLTYSSPTFSKDGDTLVACNGAAEMWDLKSGRHMLAHEGHLAMIRALDLTADGTIAASSDHLNIILWDVKAGKELRRIDKAAGASSLSFSPDGKTLATNGDSDDNRSYAVLWDVATGKQLRRIPVEKDAGRVAFSPDGKTLAVASGHQLTVCFFDVQTGKETRTIVGNRGNEFGMYMYSIRFSPDGRHFASFFRVDDAATVALWDLNKGVEPIFISRDTGHVGDVAFSVDGEYLAWSDMHDVHMLDVRERKLLPTLKGAGPGALSFTSDGHYLVAGKKMHPLNPKHPPRELPIASYIRAFSRDGSTLVAAGNYAATLLVIDLKKAVK